MALNVKFTYDDEFVEILEEVKDKYPEKLFELDGIGRKNLDINALSRQFFKPNSSISQFTVDPNANVTFSESILVYNTEIHKGVDRLNSYYVLYREAKKLYGFEEAKKAVIANIIGDIYTHDFHTFALNSYCFAFSALDIVEKGLPFLGEKLHVGPTQHADSFINVLIQAISYYSNSIAGAVAFPDLFGVLQYLINKDIVTGDFPNPKKEPEKYKRQLHQLFQNFVYGINWPFRGGVQSAFVNISIFDRLFISNLFGNYFVGENQLQYKPSIDQIDNLQKEFVEYFNNSLLKEHMFTFPVITANLVEDFIIEYSLNEEKKVEKYSMQAALLGADEAKKWLENVKKDITIKDLKITRVVQDQDFKKWLADINKDKMLINIYIGKLGQLSTCCRLRNDTTQFMNDLKEGKESLRPSKEEIIQLEESSYFNSFGSGNDVKIGSHRVVTINLPRIALKSKTKETFLQNLKEVLSLSQKILHVQRYIVEQRIMQGKLPLYTHGFMDLKRQFSTIGIIGTYEMTELMGYDIRTPEGKDFQDSIIDFINNENKKESIKFNHPYNLEQVPGESAAYKLLNKDKLIFKQVAKYDQIKDMYFYSNQIVPVQKDITMEERIQLQGRYDAKLTGGAILHINVASSMTKEQSERLLDYTVSEGVIYFAFNPTFSVCEDGHIEVGRNKKCSVCGKNIKDYYTRIVGFLVPVSSWADVRKEHDFPERRLYGV